MEFLPSAEEPSPAGIDVYWKLAYKPPSFNLEGSVGLRYLHVALFKRSTPYFDTNSIPKTFLKLPGSLLVNTKSSGSKQVKFFQDTLKAYSRSDANSAVLIFILPYTTGWVSNANFLELRLSALNGEYRITSFAEPLQECFLNNFDLKFEISDVLNTAVGALVKDTTSPFEFQDLEDALLGRLNFRWLSQKPLSRRRVALICGRANLLVGGSIYSTAIHLGVDLVIVDDKGHWLQEDNTLNKSLREGFIEVDMKEDNDLVARIVAGIRQYPHPIDGLFTLEDQLHIPVARASTELSLPTSPVHAYEIASDKHASRAQVAVKGEFTAVNTEQELIEAIGAGSFIPNYPLIVKPRARAWASQYIFKAANEDELKAAVNHIVKKYEAGAIIEPYYDGPEIDLNLVMVNGEAMFVELVDELPSNGDINGDQKSHVGVGRKDFLETGLTIPSLMPQSEQRKAVAYMTDLLKRLGFRNAVLHTEARLTNSAIEYSERDGVVDLVKKEASVAPHPEDFRCHLIEINTRPPGLPAIHFTKHTFGVDYYANAILIAVGETRERLDGTCQTFSIPKFPAGAQCFSQLCLLPILKGGFPREETDPFKKLLEDSLPECVPYVANRQCYFYAGQALPAPNECLAVFMGHVIVVSTKSRREVMEVAERIRSRWYQMHNA